MMKHYVKLACFVGGALFGSAGVKLLASKDAKKAYTHITAAGLRMKDSVMETVTSVQENAADILAAALQQAKEARATILEVINECIDGPAEMSEFAPRIITTSVPVEKIGEVIGPKGKTINGITEETGADISIEDDGTVFVSATSGKAADAAIEQINAIANPQLPKVGERYLGTVVKTVAFGAFVSLTPGRDGLIHISKLGGKERIEKVEDVINVGEKVEVEIADIDNRGKISLIPVDGH